MGLFCSACEIPSRWWCFKKCLNSTQLSPTSFGIIKSMECINNICANPGPDGLQSQLKHSTWIRFVLNDKLKQFLKIWSLFISFSWTTWMMTNTNSNIPSSTGQVPGSSKGNLLFYFFLFLKCSSALLYLSLSLPSTAILSLSLCCNMSTNLC